MTNEEARQEALGMYSQCLNCKYLKDRKNGIYNDLKTAFYCDKKGSMIRAWITKENKLVVFINDDCPAGQFVKLDIDKSNFTFDLGGNHDF